MAGWGRLIEDARKAEGLTRAELAEKLAVNEATVWKLENEKQGVTPAVYVRLTMALRQSLRPVELVEALGYPVIVESEDRALPHDLVRICRQLDADQLRIVTRLARGLLLENRNPPGGVA